MELSFPGFIRSVERKVQELSLRGTVTLVELSLLRNECPKNFRSLELLLTYLKKLGEESITAVCP